MTARTERKMNFKTNFTLTKCCHATEYGAPLSFEFQLGKKHGAQFVWKKTAAQLRVPQRSPRAQQNRCLSMFFIVDNESWAH